MALRWFLVAFLVMVDAQDIQITTFTDADGIATIVADMANQSLTTIDSLTITNNVAITTLEDLMANITRIAGKVTISGCANLESVTFGKLQRIEGTFTLGNLRAVSTIAARSLEVITGSWTITECQQASAAAFSTGFASLVSVDGNVYLRNLARNPPGGDFELESLKTVGGLFDIHDGQFSTIGLPLLETVGGGFVIWRQTLLQHLDLPSLKSVGGNILFQQLIRLHSLCDVALPEVGFSGDKAHCIPSYCRSDTRTLAKSHKVTNNNSDNYSNNVSNVSSNVVDADTATYRCTIVIATFDVAIGVANTISHAVSNSVPHTHTHTCPVDTYPKLTPYYTNADDHHTDCECDHIAICCITRW